MDDPIVAPTTCPFCGDETIFVNGFSGVSIDAEAILPVSSHPQQLDLDEYQCRSENCGRSFWV